MYWQRESFIYLIIKIYPSQSMSMQIIKIISTEDHGAKILLIFSYDFWIQRIRIILQFQKQTKMIDIISYATTFGKAY